MASVSAAAGEPPRPTRAFVTLLTSDSYLAGALTAINSLLDVEGAKRRDEYDTVCLVTPATVGQASIKALQKVFDQVVGVAEITTRSWHELDLLGRNDLAASLTKLHLWRLSQYRKVIFLDADTLVLRPLTPLFDLDVDFAAAPDSGWPDSFNSGVMLATPSSETFDGLIRMMDERGTWDGGDQGLLNDFFPNWHRLQYTYNVTPSAYYTYAPAFRRHGHNVSVLHFIGKNKPWNRGSRGTFVVEDSMKDYYNLVGLWYDVYERHYGGSLTYDVANKVVAPPSFESHYTSLAPHQPSRSSKPPVASTSRAGADSPPKLEWDPAVNPPPSKDHQMREAITARYDSVWDDPSTRKQKMRFQPPSSYPNIPASTHEWYKDVMQKKPDPSAVRPVFPWEEPKLSSRPSQPPSPTKPPTRAFPPSPTSSQNDEAPIGFQPRQSYTNAWDSVPGINRYAKSLAKATKRRASSTDAAAETQAQGPASGSEIYATGAGAHEPGSGSAARETTSSHSDSMGGRKSSLKEPKPYRERSDASSRDGDDEDEDETASSGSGDDEDDVDRPRIAYRRTSSQGSVSQRSRSHSGETSPNTSRSRNESTEVTSGETTPSAILSPGGATSPPKSRRFVPNSPRASRTVSSEGPLHHQPAHHSAAPLKSAFRLSPVPSSHPSSGNGSGASPLPATSPRLAAQAIRNSTAARLTSAGSGVGDGPPVVRATRVFSPETDTGVVKQQGLAALQRFVENFEAAQASGGSPPPEYSNGGRGGNGGGPGTGGAWRW